VRVQKVALVQPQTGWVIGHKNVMGQTEAVCQECKSLRPIHALLTDSAVGSPLCAGCADSYERAHWPHLVAVTAKEIVLSYGPVQRKPNGGGRW
jgi:hypothetical protein